MTKPKHPILLNVPHDVFIRLEKELDTTHGGRTAWIIRAIIEKLAPTLTSEALLCTGALAHSDSCLNTGAPEKPGTETNTL